MGLIPFYYSRKQLTATELTPKVYNQLIKTYSQNNSLLTYPREHVKDEFYSIIKTDPVFYFIRCRYLSGFFSVQEEGIDQPDADILAAWKFKSPLLSHPNQCYVFFVDDTYYAGDIMDMLNEANNPQQRRHIPHVRLLFRIKEPNGTAKTTS